MEFLQFSLCRDRKIEKHSLDSIFESEQSFNFSYNIVVLEMSRQKCRWNYYWAFRERVIEKMSIGIYIDVYFMEMWRHGLR